MQRLCVGLSPKIQDILKFVIPVQNVDKKEADSFQRTSTRVARKYWWKNIKMMIIIGVIGLIILILIILAATKVI
ncbi:hypothetical protein ILYODFUR_014969 [Ilyodon furcidens]|uniref:V-SNARE coiled-coil homology domain-containing protein n=1 Tax=Ilyodon furcidens TaxID=33524 RepID=A0ABV0TMH4_9TELE